MRLPWIHYAGRFKGMVLLILAFFGGMAGAYLIGGTGYFFVNLLNDSADFNFKIGTGLMILGFVLGSGATVKWLARRSTFQLNPQRLKKIF